MFSLCPDAQSQIREPVNMGTAVLRPTGWFNMRQLWELRPELYRLYNFGTLVQRSTYRYLWMSSISRELTRSQTVGTLQTTLLVFIDLKDIAGINQVTITVRYSTIRICCSSSLPWRTRIHSLQLNYRAVQTTQKLHIVLDPHRSSIIHHEWASYCTPNALICSLGIRGTDIYLGWWVGTHRTLLLQTGTKLL